MKNKTITHFDQFNLRKYIFKSLRLKKTIQTIPLSYNTSTISLLVSSRVSTLPSPPPIPPPHCIYSHPWRAYFRDAFYDKIRFAFCEFEPVSRWKGSVTREKKILAGSVRLEGREREGGRGKRERKKEADKKKRRMGTTGTRVVTFPFEIRVCTYGFQNVERHK